MKEILTFVLINPPVSVEMIASIRGCISGKTIIFASTRFRVAKETSELISDGLIPIKHCDTGYSPIIGDITEFLGFQKMREHVAVNNPTTLVIIENQAFLISFIALIEKLHKEAFTIPGWKTSNSNRTKHIAKKGQVLCIEIIKNKCTLRLL